MSIVSESRPWKTKYKELVKELDRLESASKENEKLLRRTIIWLAQTAKGLDQTLDPHLSKIYDLAKKDVEVNSLGKELESLSQSLMTAETRVSPHSKTSLDTSALLGFLEYCGINNEQSQAISSICEKFKNGNFSDPHSLNDEILTALTNLDTAPQPQNLHFIKKLFSKIPVTNSQDSDQLKFQLSRLLGELEIPLNLHDKSNALKSKLELKSQDISSNVLLDDTIDLLVGIKSYVQHEQQQIEEFLAQLTGRLGELSNQVTQTDELSKSSAQNRSQHDKTVSDQVEILRTKSENIPDISELKRFVQSTVDVFSSQLNLYKETESDRQLQTQQLFDKLTERLQQLEIETNQLQSKLRLARHKALIDPLTELPNRLAYDERLTQEYARWRRFNHLFSLIIWDIDNFKNINDRFGHKAGDKALKTIARSLSSNLRETDFIARYGGEEFITLLPGANTTSAEQIANKLRTEIRNCGFNSKGNAVAITISCGISQFLDGDTPEQVFERADKALYQAKCQGRDRCVTL